MCPGAAGAYGGSGIALTPKLESYKRKLQASLAARFYLRFHVSLILLFSIVCGWVVDLLLLKIGLRPIIVRYPLAVLGAYIGFLSGVWVWIEYSGIREYMNQRKSEELVGDQVREAREKPGANPIDIADLGNLGIDGEGCVVIIAVVIGAIVLFYFFGGYLIANAAALFSEIVVELLLAAGLLRGLNRIEASGWLLGTMNATFWPLIFTLTIAILFGWWAGVYHPGAITLGQILAK